MKINDPTGMGWSQCTSKGSETAQLRVWMKLSFRAKLEALETLGDLSRSFLEQRQKAGLPYIDPYTGRVVRPSKEQGRATEGRQPAAGTQAGVSDPKQIVVPNGPSFWPPGT